MATAMLFLNSKVIHCVILFVKTLCHASSNCTATAPIPLGFLTVGSRFFGVRFGGAADDDADADVVAVVWPIIAPKSSSPHAAVALDVGSSTRSSVKRDLWAFVVVA